MKIWEKILFTFLILTVLSSCAGAFGVAWVTHQERLKLGIKMHYWIPVKEDSK